MVLVSSLISVFCIVLFGAICCKKEVFNKAHIEGIELLLFKIIIPSYLFTTTYEHDLFSLLNPRFILSYLVTFIILAIVAFIFAKRAPMAEVYIKILASGYVNAAIYTLPIITFLLKNPTAAIIGNILQVVIIQPIFLILLNVSNPKEKSFGKKLANIFITPLIIMPLVGILLNYLQINIPAIIIEPMNRLGGGASGIALFAFGLAIGAIKIPKKCLNLDLLSLVFYKNILHPTIALGIAYCMNLESYWFNSLIISSSAPTAFVVYLIAKQFAVKEELIKNAIALSSIMSIVSLIIIASMI